MMENKYKIGIIGLGYVGFPLACLFARKYPVIGFDINERYSQISFYNEEMNLRRDLCYSPYFYITLVNITSKDYDIGFKEANKIGEYLRKNLDSNTKVLGPSMANIFRINNIYIWNSVTSISANAFKDYGTDVVVWTSHKTKPSGWVLEEGLTDAASIGVAVIQYEYTGEV